MKYVLQNAPRYKMGARMTNVWWKIEDIYFNTLEDYIKLCLYYSELRLLFFDTVLWLLIQATPWQPNDGYLAKLQDC